MCYIYIIRFWSIAVFVAFLSIGLPVVPQCTLIIILPLHCLYLLSFTFHTCVLAWLIYNPWAVVEIRLSKECIQDWLKGHDSQINIFQHNLIHFPLVFSYIFWLPGKDHGPNSSAYTQEKSGVILSRILSQIETQNFLTKKDINWIFKQKKIISNCLYKCVQRLKVIPEKRCSKS